MIPNDSSSFADINEYIMGLIGRFGSENLDLILRAPFSSNMIRDLKRDKWKILFSPLTFAEATTDYIHRRMIISTDLGGYKRDRAICHEIVHAVYGQESLSDNLIQCLDAQKNNAIVDWYSRHIRASPILLSEIWRTFNVASAIYDRASLLATQQLVKPQLLFPSLERDYNFTLID